VRDYNMLISIPQGVCAGFHPAGCVGRASISRLDTPQYRVLRSTGEMIGLRCTPDLRPAQRPE
jgi:hypothetical protein